MTAALDLTRDKAREYLADLDRDAVSRWGLRKFVSLAWHQVEPGRYRSNWHIDAICEHLEAVLRGEIRNLMIAIPPGCMKSSTVSTFFPAWTWTQDPAHKFIAASYGQDLSDRDARRHRDIVTSPWFQERWGDRVTITSENVNRVRFFENTARGFRFSTSIGGDVTGRHANTLILDDPNKAQDATCGSAEAMQRFDKSWSFWSSTMSSRQADPETTRKIVIAQRLHEADVPGRIHAEDTYTELVLPMEFNPKRRCVTVLGDVDPRDEEGELLWPERFPRAEVDTLRRNLGPIGAAAQLDQEPVPAGGAIFKLDEFKFWKVMPALERATLIQSWDCAFKGMADSDYVVGQVWAMIGGEFYLLDQVRDHLSFTETCTAIRALRSKWRKATRILIEDKANGPAIISALKKDVPGLIPVNPEGGKVARANAVSPFFRSGNVYIPDPDVAPWVSDYIQELITFDRGKHDDQVDASTQALTYLMVEGAGYMSTLREAMKRGLNG